MLNRLAKAAEGAGDEYDVMVSGEEYPAWSRTEHQARAVLRELGTNPDMELAQEVFGGSWFTYEAAQLQKYIFAILQEKPDAKAE